MIFMVRSTTAFTPVGVEICNTKWLRTNQGLVAKFQTKGRNKSF